MGGIIPVTKDDEFEQPVPSIWRPSLKAVADALTAGNGDLRDIPDVMPLDDKLARLIERQIESYGSELSLLPEEAWESSVCRWQLTYWEVLIDLYTKEEGRSDLVLHMMVSEQDNGFRFETHLVYVP